MNNRPRIDFHYPNPRIHIGGAMERLRALIGTGEPLDHPWSVREAVRGAITQGRSIVDRIARNLWTHA